MKICLECKKKMGDALKECPYCRGKVVFEGDERLSEAAPAVAASAILAEQAESELLISAAPPALETVPPRPTTIEEGMTPAQKEAALEAILMAAKKEKKKPMSKGKAMFLYLMYMLMMGAFAKWLYAWMYG